MRPGSSGVDYALGNSLVVKVRDLFTQVMILQQNGAPRTGLQRMVGIAQPQALGCSQVLAGLGT
ncbi:UNVERIFIED_ORG: hypothetical protein J3D58_000588 [Paenarthrobacter nicotinovorans]